MSKAPKFLHLRLNFTLSEETKLGFHNLHPEPRHGLWRNLEPTSLISQHNMEPINGPVIFHISASIKPRSENILEREKGERMLNEVCSYWLSQYFFCLFSGYLLFFFTYLTMFKQQGLSPPLSILPYLPLHPSFITPPPTCSLPLSSWTLIPLLFFSQKNFRFVIYYLQEKLLSESVCYRGPLH